MSSFISVRFGGATFLSSSIKQYDDLLTDNRIWKQRLVNIGIVSANRAKQLGFTGPM
jgi:NADH-quinone oxidoreductase subunit D